MIEGTTPISGNPQISIIIAAYDDWNSLDGCLRSLHEQTNAPPFEVIVVDDGSEQEAPEFARSWGKHYALKFVRQQHAGIPTARNRGIQESSGQVVLFIDADCRLEADCLSALSKAIADFPQHDSFQLRLIGDCSTLLGRAEHLRLVTLQNHMLQADGRIRYLNTAGFAIRKSHEKLEKELFDPVALRGEDTLLLTTLIERGELPYFAAHATVRHFVSLSFAECLKKDIRSAWLEGRTFDIIEAKGIRPRMRNKQRLNMLQVIWRESANNSIGRAAFFVLLARQLVERTVSLLYKLTL
jgi:glycosyltransferase involved in cell wall biosynthesis